MKLKSILLSNDEITILELVVNQLELDNIGFHAFIYNGERDFNEKKIIYAINSHDSFVVKYYDARHGLYERPITKYYAIVNMPIENFMILFEKYKKLKVFI
jgi:hypothetical protein